MNFLTQFASKSPSILNDPFSKSCVHAVRIHAYKNSCNGKVEFVNGRTKGEQDFRGKTFDEVTLKIKSFIESL